jgi:hypothetical protein
MKRNANTRAGDNRLRGKQYEPPARPSIVRSNLRTRLTDKVNARGTGGVMAQDGEILRGDDGTLHYASVIDAHAEGALAGVEQSYETPKGKARNTGRDAELRQADAKRELAQLEVEDAELAAEEDHLKDRRGLRPFGYAALIVLLYCITLPYDIAAASGLPIAPAMSALAGLTIGALLMVAAHWTAHKEQDIDEARLHEPDPDHPTALRKALIQHRAVLAGTIGLIIGIGVWRAGTFQAQAEATGGIFAGGVFANIAFTLLALVAFLSAYLAGQAYLKLHPLRKVRAKRKKNRTSRQVQQSVVDTFERVAAQAALTLELLKRDQAAVVGQIEAWREARTHKFLHDVRVREHRRRQQQRNGASEDAAPLLAIPPSSAPDSRLRPIDVSALADDVKTRANHNSTATRP